MVPKVPNTKDQLWKLPSDKERSCRSSQLPSLLGRNVDERRCPHCTLSSLLWPSPRHDEPTLLSFTTQGIEALATSTPSTAYSTTAVVSPELQNLSMRKDSEQKNSEIPESISLFLPLLPMHMYAPVPAPHAHACT